MSLRQPSTHLLLLAAAVLLASCGSRSPATVDEDALSEAFWHDLAALKSAEEMRTRLGREVLTFAHLEQELVERKAAFATAVIAARSRIVKGEPLGGGDIEELNRSFTTVLDSVGMIAPLAARHATWRHTDAQTCAEHGVIPPDDLLRLEGVALSAAASLALYDTFLLNCELVLDCEPVRKALNQGDPGLGLPEDQLDAVIRCYLSYGRRTRVHRCLRDLTRAGDAWATCDHPRPAWLRERIAASPSGLVLTRTRRVPLDQAGSGTMTLLASDLREIGDSVVGGVSQGFGNAVGLVSFRRGKLHGEPAIERLVRSALRPGDILLEKTPFRLTDRFIPGHWGHVALWVGGEDDLRALGLWDDPLVQRHAAALSAGKGVVEALRDDVQLNPLARFLDIDDLCVVRQPAITDDARRAIVLRALRQLGKPYDFNFDVETADCIVCSELVYQVYTGITWPTGRAAGRWTISPDQVARRALPGGPLTVIDLWHDGKRVAENQPAELAKLLGEPAGGKP